MNAPSELGAFLVCLYIKISIFIEPMPQRLLKVIVVDFSSL